MCACLDKWSSLAEESEDEEFVEPEFVLAVEPIETTEDDQQEPEQEPEGMYSMHIRQSYLHSSLVYRRACS